MSENREPEPSSKKQKLSVDDELKRFYRSWAWKREHRPDKDRFHRPYKHTITVPGTADPVTVSIRQQKFGPEGFASMVRWSIDAFAVVNVAYTVMFGWWIRDDHKVVASTMHEAVCSAVWDSAIVVAKYAEKWPQLFAGKRCCDLSAGCGLVGVVMAKLGASVTATDLEPNLPLLRSNCKDNGVPGVAVLAHRWGRQLQQELAQPFDVITACDVMYIDELVLNLVQSLLLLSHQDTTILIAHGRNRPAQPAFRAAAEQHFEVALVPAEELDEVYQCSDVDVLRLRRLQLERQNKCKASAAVGGASRGHPTCK